VVGVTVVERFMSKVDQRPDGCWIWTAQRNAKGYGCFSINGRSRPAHRVAFALFVRPIPAGMFVCHRCDNPSCVNPAHLFIGTAADNSADMVAKGRPRGARSPLIGESHPAAKLSVRDIAIIRREAAEGTEFSELARRFGVTAQAIKRIVARQTWRHVA
jgi:hypothetical protein